MNSSEIVRSGRVSGARRSSFSQTCSRLSQFLKENDSFEDLSLSLTNNLETRGVTTETMNLFPMIEKPGLNPRSGNPNMPLKNFPQLAAGRDGTYKKSNLSVVKPDPETAQMTIFYAGQVIVFDDFPTDKAKDIMNMASKSSGATRNHHNASVAPPHAAQSPAESTAAAHNIVPTFGTDLPIARKNSLAQFLEKRKDRITANAPYKANKPKPSALKPAKEQAWLGLAPEF